MIHWDAVAAIIAALIALATYLTWFVRVTTREQNDELLQRINGTYVRSMGSTLTGAEAERRLTKLEQRAQHGD